MKFVSVRDIRTSPGVVWKALNDDPEIIVTSNGKPIALMTPVDKDNLESALQNNRRARAFSALEAMQASARKRGLDRMTPEEVDELIASTRRQRRRAERTDA